MTLLFPWQQAAGNKQRTLGSLVNLPAFPILCFFIQLQNPVKQQQQQQQQ
jgi:hypothetical protein